MITDSVVFGVIIEPTDVGDEVTGLLKNCAAEHIVTVFRPVYFTIFLKFVKTFIFELLFVQVTLNYGTSQPV